MSTPASPASSSSSQAVSTPIVLEGHLIDSLTLAKVIDTIQKKGGDYVTNHIQVGWQKEDISSANITVSANDENSLHELLNELAPYGVKTATSENAALAKCPADGEPPEHAMAIKLPSRIRLNNEWVNVVDGGTELYVVVSGGAAYLKQHRALAAGEDVVVSPVGVEW